MLINTDMQISKILEAIVLATFVWSIEVAIYVLMCSLTNSFSKGDAFMTWFVGLFMAACVYFHVSTKD